jgi:ferredoxin
MLKIIRRTLAVLVMIALTFFFIDFAGLLPNDFHILAHLQFIPAVMSAFAGGEGWIILLGILLLTLLLGRIYCSVLCPLGILQDVVNWVAKLVFKKKRRFSYGNPKNILRYVVLGVVVLAFLFNFTLFVGLFDPYSAYGRVATHLFKPVYLFGNNLLASYFAYTESYYLYEVEIMITSMLAFTTAIITLLIVGLLAWLNGRTYCNTICPVGTILGFLSKYSFFKVRIDNAKCNSCGLCSMNCKASCIDAASKTIDYSRCVDCFNCIGKCNRGAMKYGGKQTKKLEVSEVTSERRQFLQTSAMFGMVATASVILPKSTLRASDDRIKPLTSPDKHTPVTPPGARSQHHLLSHCTSCHLCIDRCPNKCLVPAKFEYGIGGVMQPTMDYENGFCVYDCKICSEVCPNNAIGSFETLAEKQHTQIGIAKYKPDICQVNTMNVSCGKCAEECPTGAIHLVQNGSSESMIPVVDEHKCIGCGMCEYVCPTPILRKAIRVDGCKEHKRI